MPGDVVRRMSGGELKGYVTDCQMTCSVLIKGTNKFIHGVDSKLFSEISSVSLMFIVISLLKG